MTNQTKKQLKETAVETGKELAFNPWMLVVVLDTILNSALSYWSMISPALGDMAVYIQCGFAGLIAIIKGIKIYRNKTTKVGGTK